METVFKDWTIDKCIGEGAFGKVYRIVREDFGHTYEAALKVIEVPQSQSEVDSIRNEGMTEQNVTEYFHSMVEDIVEEFALMSRLKGNSNIVSYEDHSVVTKEDGFGWDIYIRMELLTPLFDHMKEHKMTVRDVIQIGIDICRALEICQKYNIIHRDIKPENIFVSDIGTYKLGDFGIARQLEKTTSGLSKKGTYNYMAPEVFKGLEYNSTVDIYSLGIVLYRFLNNNRLPFMPPASQPIHYSDKEKANIMRISGQRMPKPCNANGRLAEIVLKACAYNPSERYESAYSMRQALEGILYSDSERKLIYPEGDTLENKKAEYILDETNRGMRKKREERDAAGEPKEGTVYLFSNEQKRSETFKEGNYVKKEENVLESIPKEKITELHKEEKVSEKGKPVVRIEKESTEQLKKAAGRAEKEYSGTLEGVNEKEVKDNEKQDNKTTVNKKRVEDLSEREEKGIKEAEKGREYRVEKARKKEASVSEKKEIEQKKKRNLRLIVPLAMAAVLIVVVVTAVISGMTSKVTIPDLKGMTVEKAEAELEKKKLILQIEQEEYSDSVEDGQILSQNLNAGKEAEEGTIIKVTLSRGKEEAAPEKEEVQTVNVPDFVNLSQAEAQERAKEYKLSVETTEAYSDTVKKGNIISQSPVKNSELEFGGSVTLTVSKGAAKVSVPKLTGLSSKRAKALLKKNHLKYKTKNAYSSYTGNGKVMLQSIKSGKKVKKGTVIVLTISKGKKPAPAVTPDTSSSYNNYEPSQPAVTPKPEPAKKPTPTKKPSNEDYSDWNLVN